MVRKQYLFGFIGLLLALPLMVSATGLSLNPITTKDFDVDITADRTTNTFTAVVNNISTSELDATTLYVQLEDEEGVRRYISFDTPWLAKGASSLPLTTALEADNEFLTTASENFTYRLAGNAYSNTEYAANQYSYSGVSHTCVYDEKTNATTVTFQSQDFYTANKYSFVFYSFTYEGKTRSTLGSDADNTITLTGQHSEAEFSDVSLRVRKEVDPDATVKSNLNSLTSILTAAVVIVSLGLCAVGVYLVVTRNDPKKKASKANV
jgi:hypothetical protein